MAESIYDEQLISKLDKLLLKSETLNRVSGGTIISRNNNTHILMILVYFILYFILCFIQTVSSTIYFITISVVSEAQGFA